VVFIFFYDNLKKVVGLRVTTYLELSKILGNRVKNYNSQKFWGIELKTTESPRTK